jgi:hypothetical protein
MPLVPIKIPPGFFRNGTDLEGAGRWRDGSLVRWKEGSLRPIGGWRDRVASAYAAAPRGMQVWEDNSNSRWIAAGTYNKLYVMASGASASGDVYDITPAGFTAGLEDAAVNTGYGGGFYGTSFYGTARPDTGNFSEATTWQTDTWGQYLVACSVSDGNLYEWQLNTGTPAATISGAPTSCLGLMVTGERFLFALGAGGDPRKVSWSDQEDNTTWTAAATNQAGSQILQTSGRVMAGVRTIGQSLILTDTDAHRAVYVGPPFVYNFEVVGSSCGLVARKAVASTDAGVFWMGQNGFFRFDGQTVQELPCQVSDAVFLDINLAQISKTWAVANGQNGEVWWLYCSSSATEIDSYVAYDYKENHWLLGKLSRTCGVDRGVFRTPIYADDGGDVYDHETGFNYGGAEVYAESGPASIGNGDRLVNVHKLIPDEATQGEVTVTFKTRLYPNSPESTFGPYTMANPTSVRFTGRQARMRVTGNTLSAWRFGVPRVDVTEAGRR